MSQSLMEEIGIRRAWTLPSLSLSLSVCLSVCLYLSVCLCLSLSFSVSLSLSPLCCHYAYRFNISPRAAGLTDHELKLPKL